MSENNKVALDIIRLVKEVSKQNIDNFELEYEGIKIKMSAGRGLSSSQVIVNPDLPSASPAQIDEMQEQEKKTILERVNEKDESLLEDLDYLAPEVAGDLRRAGVIRINSSGGYEYIDQEECLDA